MLSVMGRSKRGSCGEGSGAWFELWGRGRGGSAVVKVDTLSLVCPVSRVLSYYEPCSERAEGFTLRNADNLKIS